MSGELYVQHDQTVYAPVVINNVEWTTERAGNPGKLTFEIKSDGVFSISEGDAVQFKWDNSNVFYGYVFSVKSDNTDVIRVTAYDQLRYLKNKETYVYENKTAGEVIEMIASDLEMQTGVIEDTKYKIASRIEDTQTLFDIIQNALDLTIKNTKYMYVLFDDFGKISLKSIENMIVNILIDEETAETYSYTSSIDEQTYNRIKLYFDNEDTGAREVYIAQDSNNMQKWGVLQYYEALEEGENGQAKADALLELYNKPTKKLNINGAFGDCRVRAGSMIVVMLKVGDVKIANLMLVESCKHAFSLDSHLMDLNLRGGEFNG